MSSADSPPPSPAGIIIRPTRPTAGCRPAFLHPPIIPIRWCWCPNTTRLGTKLLLDNVMLPAAWGNQTVTSTSTNDAYCSQDLEMALDSIFNNQNVGPFICRQLIQRLVTSNPSRDYLYRVAQVFNDDGAGVRGDLQAVIQAILLDYEARSTDLLTQPTYGKQREPLLRVTAAARALPPARRQAGTYNETGTHHHLHHQLRAAPARNGRHRSGSTSRTHPASPRPPRRLTPSLCRVRQISRSMRQGSCRALTSRPTE